MILILLGAPGAGKGTIANYLKEKYNYISISTGDVIRNEIKTNPEFAKKIKAIVAAGKLVSDDIVNELIKKFLTANKKNKNIILDGYPRTVEQAKYLDTLVKVDRVVELNVDKKVLIQRVLGRYSCPKCGTIFNIYNKDMKPAKSKNKGEYLCTKCNTILVHRGDDNEETFNTRYKQFLSATKIVAPFYKERGILSSFDASLSGQEFIDAAMKAIQIN